MVWIIRPEGAGLQHLLIAILIFSLKSFLIEEIKARFHSSEFRRLFVSASFSSRAERRLQESS